MLGKLNEISSIPTAIVRILLTAAPLFFPPASLQAEEFEFYNAHVGPVLFKHCIKCHGPDKQKGGLRLDRRADALKGGDEGPAFVPGKSGESLLVKLVSSLDPEKVMPPKGERLTEEQIGWLKAWIDRGAPWPNSLKLPPPSTQASTNSHWSFLPPIPQLLPEVKMKPWPQSPLDHFVLAKLEESGLTPSRPADKRTLIRRATYDLTGLPPTAEEVEAFVQDLSPNAFVKVVDRLLASPRYGERWGRHWLDVARYADTKGYVYYYEESRFVHPHTYRDWVIRAFNDDLPYDQFLMLQIAADQLSPSLTSPPSTLQNPLPALGFLTLGRRFLGVESDIIDDQIDVLMRGTQGLTVSCARCHDHKFDPIPTKDYYSLYGIFQGSIERVIPLTEHPNESAEYLEFARELEKRKEKLAATFKARCEEMSDRLRSRTVEYLSALLEVDKLPGEEVNLRLGLDDLNPANVRQWQTYLSKRVQRSDAVFAPWQAFASLPGKEFSALGPALAKGFTNRDAPYQGLNPLVAQLFITAPASMLEVAERYGKLLAATHKHWRDALEAAKTNNVPAPIALTDPAEEELRQVLYAADSPVNPPPGPIMELTVQSFFHDPARVELSTLNSEIERWIITAPGAPLHAVILEDRLVQRNPRVFVRGNPSKKGEEVPRQFPQVLAGEKRLPFMIGSGRLELAQAIASPHNPLTARVMVNRIWLHHFGIGLVSTPSDFGTRSDPPSHPELLDWLARRFIAEGWSIKTMHRLIMLSSTYQQRSDIDMGDEGSTPVASSSARGNTEQFNPISLSSQARIKEHSSIETDPENRLLSRLNRQRLDFEAMRDSLLAVTGELNFQTGGRAVDLMSRPFSARRTVYGNIDRKFLPSAFRIFDFANPDTHAPQRYATTVPQQALFFMNNPFIIERARALIRRPDVQVIQTSKQRIQHLYRLVYQREPTSREVYAGLRLLDEALPEPLPERPKPPAPVWQYGYGEFDEAASKLNSFEPLPYFAADAWQGGMKVPDPKLGWVQLNAEGGRAGNDLRHVAIRRWIAPEDCVVWITGTITHAHNEGEGIQVHILRRNERVGGWVVRNERIEANVVSLELKQGEKVDFIVAPQGARNSKPDTAGRSLEFKWAPILKSVENPTASATPSGTREWNAKKEFSGPPAEPPQPITAWEQYAQVLLLSNEFVFVD